jgi:hypothetical protein
VAEPDERLLLALRWQRAGCAGPSPLYAKVLDAVIADVKAGGVCAAVLADPGDEAIAEAFVLRFLGAVHRLVLSGRAPELAAFYPSAGGTDGGDPGPAFIRTVAAMADDVRAGLEQPVQTNEVGRAAALVVGFLDVAARAALPLRVFEIGASAGLNLRWDQFRYEGGRDGTTFGPADSPVRLDDEYRDPRPFLHDRPVDVAERRGCDARPIDPTTDAGQLLLRGFLWPDQAERFARLDAAIEVAADVPATVDRADAGEWVHARLAAPVPGTATIVYHSIVWQYLSPATAAAVTDAFDGAAARATRDAPLAWVRFEPAADPTKGVDVTVRTWPGGEERIVARCWYHGKPVRSWPLPAA